MNEGRREIIQVVFVLVAVVFLIKLFFIQVIDSRYKQLADSNAILAEVDYPLRKIIHGRYNSIRGIKKFSTLILIIRDDKPRTRKF